jgi:hypothetical protein
MEKDAHIEKVEPPIGLAVVACAICLVAILFAVKFVSRFIDIAWLTWLFATFIPIIVAFVILHRSAWHQELSTVTRILSLLLSACIIYVVVLAVLGFGVMVAATFFGNDMISS